MLWESMGKPKMWNISKTPNGFEINTAIIREYKVMGILGICQKIKNSVAL